MNFNLFFATVAWCLGIGFGLEPSAHAWEYHQALMRSWAESLPPALSVRLNYPVAVPCKPTLSHPLQKWANDWQLNLEPALKITTVAPKPFCNDTTTHTQTTLLRVLTDSAAVDEPDFGIDQDLPAQVEGGDDRRWMGGFQGPTSQGFRHMYFGGWDWTSPLQTFQVPLSPVGQAFSRAVLFAENAQKLLKSGDLYWGARVLGWSLHYVQDLSQPFHAIQIPDLSLVPWSALFHWPPAVGFKNLVTETTRVISNYHFAYEGYTLTLLKAARQEVHSPQEAALRLAGKDLESCAALPPQYAVTFEAPNERIRKTWKESQERGPALGKAVAAFFGEQLKATGVDLPQGHGVPDYIALATNSALTVQRSELHSVICKSLQNASRSAADWVHWATPQLGP